MPCDPCKASSDLPSGWMGDCPSCGEFRWYPGDGNKLFLVPGIRAGKLPIVAVQDEREAIVKDLIKPKRTRLLSKYRYGAKSKKEPDHIEYLLGIVKPRGKGWSKRMGVFQKHVNEFGLNLTQLVPRSEVKDSEPLLLHWLGVDPFLTFPEMQTCPDPAVTPYSAEDANYPSYHTTMNMHEYLFGDPFRTHQRKAIEQILKHSGSRQIIALPTGYGKTRIVQTVTNVLRSYDKGPTLMITPIIALRDDQREAFEKDFRGNAKSIGRDFKGRFVTAAGADQDEIIDELINDELDLLCCAPEQLLNPSQNMSWIEVFRRMKKPFSTLVVDEAHVVGDWGSSFRSHFLLLGQLKDRLVEMNQELRVVLQSATITKYEENELKSLFDQLLDLPGVRAFDTREDLHFRVDLEEPVAPEGIKRRTIDYESNTKAVVRYYRDAPGLWLSPWDDQNDTGRAPLLIYSAIKKDAEERIRPVLEERFGEGNVETYTGDTDESKRDRLRIRFKTNKMDAMVATSAFGMGIDKPDVWMIAYLGLPFTLKGLYQGFGRAARGSNWDHHTDKPVRNGCCMATLPKENPNQTRKFRPELRMELAAERLWDMMMSEQTSHIQDKGYLVAPVLEGLHSPLWMQTDKQVSDYVKAVSSETPDEEDEDYDTTGLTTQSQKDAWEQAERSFDLGRRSTYFKNLGFRMWSLACLQRKRAVSILGFYPKTLYKDSSDGSSVELEEALRLGGHQEVIEALKHIDESPRIGTPEGQPRLAVIRFNQPMISWDGILKALEEGHNDLRDRHQRGNQELKEFIDDVDNGVCLRRAFAPAIGASRKSSKNCIQLLEDWKDSGAREKKEPPVPCHSCIPNLPFTLSTWGEGSPLWLDRGNLRILRGDPEPEPAPPNPLDPTWENTGEPILVFKPPLDENENLVWRVPAPVPVKFYGDDGGEVRITQSKSGRYYLIDDPPLGSGALAVFRGDRGPMGRFVKDKFTDDLIDRWIRLGVKVRRS